MWWCRGNGIMSNPLTTIVGSMRAWDNNVEMYDGNNWVRLEAIVPKKLKSIANDLQCIELHRWLQDLADQKMRDGRDIICITDCNPSSRNYSDFVLSAGKTSPFKIRLGRGVSHGVIQS